VTLKVFNVIGGKSGLVWRRQDWLAALAHVILELVG